MKKNKKTEKEKSTFGEALERNLRVLKMFFRICPQKLICSFLYSIVTAMTPYVTVVFSARLVSDLEVGRDAKTYITDVVLILSVTAFLMLLGAVLNHLNEAYSDMMYFDSGKPIMDKIAGMDFEDADSERVYDLFTTAKQTQNFQGYGMYNTLNLSEKVLTAVLKILGGIGLSVTLFTSKVTDGAYAFLDSSVFALFIVGIMLGVSFLSAFFTGKVNELFVKCNAGGRFGNRCFSFFGFMVQDLSRAPDIRIYDQQKNVCVPNIRKYNMFGPGSDFAKLMNGPIGFYSSLSVGISVIVTGVIYLFVCLKSRAGAFGLGYVTQYIGAATALFVGIGELMQNVTELRANGNFLKPVFDLLGAKNKMESGSLSPKGDGTRHVIEFRDVSFKYPGSDAYSLRHVNIKIGDGKKIAVVGMNGSGKTTFIKLLCRLYDPTEGEILLDGRDIREYDYVEYMNIFSIVFQDFKLFAFPIDENVAACATPDDARVRECLAKAGFGERLASLKNGVKTYLYNDIDKDGVRVSGGEAQKIAIARALYKNAPIIVLDEPTAALDPIAEAEIYSKFNEIVGDGTAIYISHRLSSCKFCDEIAVFDGGSIVEYGDHETLLERGGKYSELWGAQAQYYAEEEKE